MSDKWKHDNWHNNENNKHKCGIAEIDNCPYCRITELEGLLMVARCPNKSCDNKGTMFDGTNIEPCRWCDERTAALGEQE